MEQKRQYKVGIIGCGRIGSLLEGDPLRGKPASHAGAFYVHPKTTIAAGCDINADNLKKFGERWDVNRLYEDHRRMLETEEFDIISVAAWTEAHADIVVHAASSGIKGIYCEKPIALNLRQAKKMIKACEKHGVAMVVGHERRWDAKFRKIREMLHSGELGQLKSITGYTLSGPPPKLARKQYGGGPMFHDGTHLVDLFRFFAGDAVSVVGLEDRPEGKKYIENTALGMMTFENGARGLILGGGERNYFHFEVDIHTDKARVILGNHTAELHMTKPSKRYSGFAELEKVAFPDTGGQLNPFVAGISELIEEMETGRPSTSSGLDGYKALEMIEALYKSAGNGRSPVGLPL